MTQIWGGDINIGRVIFTLTNSYGATSATDSYSSEANLFVTGDQSQLTYGTHENDIFYGRGVVGSSTDFYASVGNDIYYGGAGNDNLAYLNLSQSIIVNAVTSTVNFLSTGTTKTDYFTGIETIIGTRHGDYFYASDTGPKLKSGGGLSTYDLSLICLYKENNRFDSFLS